MKKVIAIRVILLFVLGIQGFAFGQTNGELDEWQIKKQKVNKRGMLILGGWAAGNIAGSGTAYFLSTGSTRAFHGMNVLWNGVNMSIALPGYLAYRRPPETGMGLAEGIAAQHSTERVYLINAGLDLAYIFGGLYLAERSAGFNATWSPRLKGWGYSIAAQGAFLLAFDWSMYFLNHNNGKKLIRILESVSVGPGTMGYRMTF